MAYQLQIEHTPKTRISCGSRGGTGGPDPPLKNHKNIGFLSNTGPDLLKNHKATKPAFNVWPSSARQRMAFRWRADDGPLLVVFGSPHLKKQQQKKKRCQSWNPSEKKTSGSAHVDGQTDPCPQ